MIDFWATGPTAAGQYLRAAGFSPWEAERLIALKRRYLRGDFRELTDAQARLGFVGWLVAHHYLSDWPRSTRVLMERRIP